MELCMREKAVFFLPVNILTVWSPAFLAARHTTVCLDFRMIYVNDCSIRLVRSFIKNFVQVFAYENYFTTKKANYSMWEYW